MQKNNSQKQILLDVRTIEEYLEGNVPGSMNIPLDKIEQSVDMISREAQILVFCASGGRAMLAKQILELHGFKDVVVGGGWRDVLSCVN